MNELRLEQADPDTKGDLFEHVLRQIKQAGELGQFRTPRHIIRFMVELLEPKPTETIGDPACGTAGFLVATMQYLLENLATRHPASVKVCALLEKPARAKVQVPIDYKGFTIPDEFVVGYGLDWDGRFRNLPFVGVVRRS